MEPCGGDGGGGEGAERYFLKASGAGGANGKVYEDTRGQYSWPG